MNLTLDRDLIHGYSSGPQRARVLSEHWAAANLYCLNCSTSKLRRLPNNSKAADLECPECGHTYELKSGRRIGRVVPDGEYATLMARLASNRNPSLLLLGYDRHALAVRDLIAVPAHFFSRAIVVARPPLRVGARRAGWIGCNIHLGGIPDSGRIALIRNGDILPPRIARQTWRSTLFLREQTDLAARGWLTTTMGLIERLDRTEFTLGDLYQFEPDLELMFPNNRNIRAKLRQQTQRLRDAGYLTFGGRGNYCRL